MHPMIEGEIAADLVPAVETAGVVLVAADTAEIKIPDLEYLIPHLGCIRNQ